MREFNLSILANNPNHVFLYEVYGNEAAVTAHGNSEHFKKYLATTANMYVAPAPDIPLSCRQGPPSVISAMGPKRSFAQQRYTFSTLPYRDSSNVHPSAQDG